MSVPPEEREAKQRSAAIDRQLRSDQREYENTIKILLLGELTFSTVLVAEHFIAELQKPLFPKENVISVKPDFFFKERSPYTRSLFVSSSRTFTSLDVPGYYCSLIDLAIVE